MKVRIKDSRFGLAIREGDSTEHASLLFIAERIAADGVIAADTLSTDENGTAATYYGGMRYDATPLERNA